MNAKELAFTVEKQVKTDISVSITENDLPEQFVTAIEARAIKECQLLVKAETGRIHIYTESIMNIRDMPNFDMADMLYLDDPEHCAQVLPYFEKVVALLKKTIDG